MDINMDRSSGSRDYSDEMYGSLLIFLNNGKKGPLFDLSKGTTVIGASVDADIRLKLLDERLEDIHCLLQVKENGITVLTNKSVVAPVKLNGNPLNKFKILKHEDHFEVLGKKFQYFNDNLSEKDYQRSHYENRKSVAPSLLTKTKRTKIPVHQQIVKETKRYTTFVSSDRSKTTSKLVVPRALSKLPKPRRRLSLNLVPEILEGRRKSIPKLCDCSINLIDLNSPHKNPNRKSSVDDMDVFLSPTKDSVVNENTPETRQRNSVIQTRRKTSSMVNTPEKSSSNLSLRETRRRYSSLLDRSPMKDIPDKSSRKQSKSVSMFEEKTPKSNVRPSRSERSWSKQSTSSTDNEKDVEEEGPDIDERVSRNSSCVGNPNEKDDDAAEENDLESSLETPETSRNMEGLEDDATPETNPENSMYTDETPKTNSRPSRNISRSSNQMNDSSIENIQDALHSEDVTPETSRKYSLRRASSVQNENVLASMNESTQATTGRNHNSSIGKSFSVGDTPEETSGQSSTNMKTPTKKRRSSMGSIQDNIFAKSLSEDKTPSTNMRSSRVLERSSRKSTTSIIDDEDALMLDDSTTSETSKRISKPAPKTSIKGNTENEYESSENDLQEKNNLEEQSTSTCHIDEENDMAISESETPENKRPLRSTPINNRRSSKVSLIEKNDSLLSQETDTPVTSMRISRSMGRTSFATKVPEENNITAETSEDINCSPDKDKNETPKNRRSSRYMDRPSEKNNKSHLSCHETTPDTKSESLSTKRKSSIDYPGDTIDANDESLIELSEDDLMNESGNKILDSISSVEGNENDSLIEILESDQENESMQSNTNTTMSKSPIKRLQRRKTFPVDASPNDAPESSNRRSLATSRRSSSVDAQSEDNLGNVSTASKSDRSISSTSSARSFQRRKTYSLDQSKDTQEVESPVRKRTSRSSVKTVDLITPSPSTNNRRSKTQPYQPKTEDITPTTPEYKKSTDTDFKTPQNTPGLFNEIKRSILKSKSRSQNFSTNLMEEFNEIQGLKRARESVGDSVRRTKKIKLVINEDDSFESITDSFQSDGILEESLEKFTENATDGSETTGTHSDDEADENDEEDSPKLKSAKSPRNDLTNIVGVKKMFATPKNAKPPKNDLTEIVGVKKMFATPKNAKPSKNDLTEIVGVKKMFATPKNAKSPKNDLTEIVGVKKMFATPKNAKSPKNDLTEIVGVKKMFATPKNVKSPENDLTNIPNLRKIMSPKSQNSPTNDLTDVRGLKQLMKTPKATRDPLNESCDMEGVAEIFRVAEAHRSSVGGSDIENNEELFDKIFEKRPVRQYRGKSTSPMGKNIDAYGKDRRKTMGDDMSVASPRVKDWVEKQHVMTLKRLEDISDKELSEMPTSSVDVAQSEPKVEETGAVDSPLALTRSRRKVNKTAPSSPQKLTRTRKNTKNAPEKVPPVVTPDATEKTVKAIDKVKALEGTPVQSPRTRRRMAKTTPQEEEKIPLKRGTRATRVEEEQQDETRVAPKRGRTAKGSVETAEKDSTSTKEEAVVSRRGRNAKASESKEKEETPATRTTSRRRQDSKAEESEGKTKETEENAEIPAKKSTSRRGRNAKIDDSDEKKQDDDEKQPRKTATRRGRSVKTVEKDETKELDEEKEEELLEKTAEKEEQDDRTEVILAKKSTSRRGRNAKTVETEEKENKVDDTESEPNPARKPPTRRVRNDESTESEQKKVDDSVERPVTRRGRNAKTVENNVTKELDNEKEEEPPKRAAKKRSRQVEAAESEEKETEKGTVPKRGRRGQNTLADPTVEEKVVPAKRSRRGKATVDDEEEVEEQPNPELQVILEKKTRSRVKSKLEEQDMPIDSPSNKRPRRNGKNDTADTKTVEKHESPVRKSTRSRGKATDKIVENGLDESASSRQTRTGRNKKTVHFE